MAHTRVMPTSRRTGVSLSNLEVATISSVKEETMRQASHPDIPPKPQPYCTQIVDHLGLVAEKWEALDLTEVLEQATKAEACHEENAQVVELASVMRHFCRM